MRTVDRLEVEQAGGHGDDFAFRRCEIEPRSETEHGIRRVDGLERFDLMAAGWENLDDDRVSFHK